jgi:hypothetical protein
MTELRARISAAMLSAHDKIITGYILVVPRECTQNETEEGHYLDGL